MELDPPLHAEVQANNLGRLVVSGKNIKEYTTARIERREGTVRGREGGATRNGKEGMAMQGWRERAQR
jgi:hypothetical protein